MALKIEMLRCFAAVARTGKLSEAALQLNRTPSAVSMMLKQLEEHLGEPLFKTDRKNRLTALGSFALEQAERELYQFDSTVHAIESFANAQHGHVRVAAVPSVAATVLPRAITEFLNRFPGVQIELRDMDSTTILHELSRGRVDIGIATAGLSASTLHCEDLLSDQFGLICSAHHPLANLDQDLTWEMISQHPFIANNLSRVITAPAFQRLHSGATLSVHNITSLLAMVRAELGVTILPEMALKTVSSEDFVFTPLPESPPERQIHLLRNADSPASPAARELESQIFATVSEFEMEKAL
ncbi:transcriptional regulator, LysR family [Aliiroseovarius halocynthiae]|uniref:LysR family transcriptional regulator n=1 Tax=Aliiroseovarius halocynthiae TaxID=985055 RepID=A0A545SSC0_9RHOB|nr:LysR family transcriptional regulator [Aliiroseovarius halocynthiae]TQV67861.1 LysR family transcriptional regulator [Aliiroseovarius halocynthiae]SMR72953.1 transcriptional regulator, LysR family [Aliiroseovarius halocynthiae]